MNTDKPEVPDPTNEQLKSVVALARAIATTIGIERGVNARETKLAVKALDTLEELQVARELRQRLGL